MVKSIETELRRAAREFADLRAQTPEEKGIFGLLLGALYGLDRAFRLKFTDRTGDKLPQQYADELASIASMLANGENVTEGQWLAGFYLNSAMQRLSPAAERMGKYVNTRHDLVPAVREEVNRLKHEVEGLLPGRTVTLEHAIDAAGLLVAAARAICARENNNC